MEKYASVQELERFAVSLQVANILAKIQNVVTPERMHKGCFIITDDKLLMIFFILFLDVER